jgi:hypothetical protein
MELELASKNESIRPRIDHTLDSAIATYAGVEHRKQRRRLLVDRRDMVRFESKSDRRHRGDRRGELKLWDGRNF